MPPAARLSTQTGLVIARGCGKIRGEGKEVVPILDKEDFQFLQEGLPFYTQLEPAQQARLRQECARLSYRQGDKLHRGSQDCAGLMLVRSGRLRVYILSQSGREITLYRLLEWDICLFSAACIFRDINFEVWIEAERGSEVILIPTALFGELSQQNIAVADTVNHLIASRFSDVMWVMEQVLFMSFDKRLALFLLEQQAIEGSGRLELTHDMIANHLGTAREVVTRMLKYFQGEGMVRLSRGMIEIVDEGRLRALAG